MTGSIRGAAGLLAVLTGLTGCSDSSDTFEPEEKIGYEILEIQAPNSIRAWISPEINGEQFDALELPQRWIKNQPREGDPDDGRFLRSPDAETDGEFLVEELYGYEWFHAATVIRPNIALDDEGLLTGSEVSKYHEITYFAGKTVYVLVSPDGDPYVRIGRDANRVSDQPTIPNLWRLEEYIPDEPLVIMLPRPVLVIRTDNEDSFQGPVEELQDEF